MFLKQNAYGLQHKFASEMRPTLYNVFPTVEELMTAWEAKIKDPCYTIFISALQVGVDKVQKYYSQFDLSLCILVNLGTSSCNNIFQSFSK